MKETRKVRKRRIKERNTRELKLQREMTKKTNKISKTKKENYE